MVQYHSLTESSFFKSLTIVFLFLLNLSFFPTYIPKQIEQINYYVFWVIDQNFDFSGQVESESLLSQEMHFIVSFILKWTILFCLHKPISLLEINL
jgi:hypothetical protein